MTKIQNFKTKKAFTLIEILTVVFLGSLIIMAAYSVYLMSYKSYQKQSAMAELTQNARVALERMSREIRQTNEILENDPTFDPPIPITDSQIKFRDGHNITPIQYINYYRNTTDLMRRVSHYYCSNDPTTWVASTTTCEAQSTLEEDITPLPEIKAQNITELQFPSNNAITIKLTVSNGSTSYKFETKVTPRNL